MGVFKEIRAQKKADLDKLMETDPAVYSRAMAKRTYTGYKALSAYRYAHALWIRGCKKLALRISYRAKLKTGIDIHPEAKIGSRVFIDHGVGVVIGQTCEIGNDVVIYQGVTLGGTGKETGKRHPTVEDGVMISAGALVLGSVRIGKGSKIGAGSVVLKDIPPYSTAVGVPGCVVRREGVRVPEPSRSETERLKEQILRLEEAIECLKTRICSEGCGLCGQTAADIAENGELHNFENTANSVEQSVAQSAENTSGSRAENDAEKTE